MTFVGQSLGWGVLDWFEQHLPSPADPEQPLVLTDEQAEIVLRWYAVDEEGQFLHRRGAIEMPKGWGKSPLAAAIAIAELVGPVVFDHWEKGEPIGRPWDNPVVEIAAVSEDQTDNTYSAIFEMLAANEHRAAKRLGIDDGRTRLYLSGRPGVLRPVTAASGSREGARLTFAILDETHLWTRRNGGVRLAGTLRRNAAKMGGRTLDTTNAPIIGEKSVAEQSGMDAGVMLVTRRPKVEPDLSWDDARLVAALREVYGDSYWITGRLERLVAEVRDPATNWDDALRFYFNIRSSGAGRAVDPRRWDALAQPRDVPAGTVIGAGFDGSVSRDATVIRACTTDGYRFRIGEWIRPTGAALTAWKAAHPGADDWTVDRKAVGDAVRRMFETYRVGRLYVDPSFWRSEIDEWEAEFGLDAEGKPRVLALDTNQPHRFAPAVDRWLTAIREGVAFHDGDPIIAEHVRNTVLRKVRLTASDDDGRTQYVLDKGPGRASNDGAIADVLALEAAMTMAAIPIAPTPRVIAVGGRDDTKPERTPDEEQAILARRIADHDYYFGDLDE